MKIELRTFRTRVARRVFVLFILCAGLPLGICSLLLYGYVRGNLLEQSQAALHTEAKTMAVSLYQRLLLSQMEMRTVAFTAGRRAAAGDDWLPHITALAHLAGGRLQPVYGEPIPPPLLSAEAERHLDAGRPVLVMVGGRDPVLVQPEEEHPSHRWVGRIDPGYLWGIAEGRPPGTELSVMGDDQRPIFTTLDDPGGLAAVATGQMAGRHTGALAFAVDRTGHLASFTTVFLRPNFFYPQWTVVLSEPRDHALAPLETFNRWFPLLVVLAMTLVVYLSTFLIRRQMGPIHLLHRATERLADGGFDHRLAIDSGDEFDDLAQAFNAMSRRIEEAQNQLVQAAKMNTMGQMAAGIVHEIRQPLTAISLNLQNLALAQPEGPVQERLRQINRTVMRLADILNRFSGFARPSQRPAEALDLPAVVDSVCQLLAHQFKMARVACRQEGPAPVPAVRGDRNQLEQVFSNLLINAIHALQETPPDERRITVRTAWEAPDVVVTIEDNGGGMPAEIRERIFEPFFTTKDDGSGLGMPIVQSILHRHGAVIDCASGESRGTVFTLRFPAANPGESP